MWLSRKSLTSYLLVILSTLSSSVIFFYGNSILNQLMIVLQLAILVTLAALNELLNSRWILMILFLNITSLIITSTFHKSFGVSIIFINLFLSCTVFNNIQVEKKFYLFIHLIPMILWTILSVFSIRGIYPISVDIVYDYAFCGIQYQKNTIGIVCLGCMCSWISIIEILNVRRILKNIISIPIIIFFFSKIIETNCRSATFALIIFCILYYSLKKDISYKWYYILLLSEIIFSGLFTIYYVENVIDIDIGDVMGRNVFHRLGTWKAAFNLVKRYPVFGSGTDIKMLVYDSAHNTILSILKTIGIIPMVTYIVCFAKRVQGNKHKKYMRICQVCVISTLTISIFESFYVDSYLYMVFLMFLINCKQNNYSDNALYKENKE